MAQKESILVPIRNSKLVKDPELFKTEIEKRIELGNILLSNDVPVIPTDPYRGYSRNRVSYDETHKKQFIANYSKWSDYNVELLKQSFNNPDNEYKDSYLARGQTAVMGTDIIKEYKDIISRQINNLESLIEKLPLIPYDTPLLDTPVANLVKPIMNSEKVFIVHGHDSGLKNEVARFIEILGFEAIILHEQPSQGNTIIEKIEKNTDVGFAVVLYTPCDVGAAKDDADKLNNRARQNVVFEHGYLIAKLSRERVCALVKGQIETPGDISGVVYISKDEGDSWKIQIAKEMKAVGYNVNFNKIM
jgi:predicted nucleotide-binding protein